MTAHTVARAWLRAGGLCAWLLAAAPHTAHAYSSFGDYARSIEEGGGGGKFFTGTPADGYTCNVCHEGAAGAKLDVIGLPASGYVPGQSYEISFRWAAAPDAAPRIALMAEFTDTRGAPAGTTSLVPYMLWTEAEKCAQDAFPAADICRAGDEPGCCRDLDPTRDACSFPGERSLFWMLECGASAARLNWTAPAQSVDDVWFSASMLTSNAGNDALGDGFSLVRQRLYPASAASTRLGAAGSCQVQSGANQRSTMSIALTLLLCSAWFALRARSRRRTRSRTRQRCSCH